MLKNFRSSRVIQSLSAALLMTIVLNAAPKKSEAGIAMIAIPPAAGAGVGLIVGGAIVGSTFTLLGGYGVRTAWQVFPYAITLPIAGVSLLLIVLDAPEQAQAQLEASLSESYPKVAAADRNVIRDVSSAIVERLSATQADKDGNKVAQLTEAEIDAALEASDLTETASPAVRAELAKLKRDLM